MHAMHIQPTHDLHYIENSVSISIDEKDIDKGIVHLLKKIEDERV